MGKRCGTHIIRMTPITSYRLQVASLVWFYFDIVSLFII